MLDAGTVVAGKLRIERVLGRGGMGTVAVATHLQLEQTVAIKVLHSELAHDPEVVARFMREARASARLKSEHVCRVSDVGQLDSGEPYFIMELLEGADLARVIEHQPLPIAYAADYVLQACVAVAEAHALGIVHRDLKSANLFVTQRMDGTPLVKVLDFGIATAPADAEFKITRTTTVMGSPGYMSPEHLRSARDVDARSDIWALGVILYEAVTGRLPFNATSITELAVKVVVDQPEPIGDAIDPRFAAIVMRCLEKPPDKRYQSVAELAVDLAPLATPVGQQAASLIARITGGPMSAAVPAAATSSIGTARTTLGTASGSALAPPPKSRSFAVIAAAGALVATGAIAAVIVVSSRGGGGGGSAKTSDAALVATAPARDAAAVPAVAIDAAAVAIAIDAAAPADDRLAAMLRKLADEHKWSEILELPDLDRDDPSVQDAQTHYLHDQGVAIDRALSNHDCAAAKRLAADARRYVPDDATLAARAAKCIARTTQPPQLSDADAAQAAYYDAHDYAKALALADKALEKDPNDQNMIIIAANAACYTKNAAKAKELIAKLRGRFHDAAEVVCAKNQVDIGRPPPAQELSDDQKQQALEHMRRAIDARKRQAWKEALADAQAVLKVAPAWPGAAGLALQAACKLHDERTAKALLMRFGPRQRDDKKKECLRDGLALP